MRKREREKKTQDLQKLITVADKNTNVKKSDASAHKTSAGNFTINVLLLYFRFYLKLMNSDVLFVGPGRPGPGRGRKRISHLHKNPLGRSIDPSATLGTPSILCSVGIKFPEVKSSGASLRSHRMKLPASVGTKKTKAIEQLLTELNVDLKPMPTEEICLHFNELRSDMVLLYELKSALATSEFELQTLKHQCDALHSGKSIDLPMVNQTLSSTLSSLNESTTTPASEATPKKTISEIIEVDTSPGTPNKKRKAALEQGNLMKKLKKM